MPLLVTSIPNSSSCFPPHFSLGFLLIVIKTSIRPPVCLPARGSLSSVWFDAGVGGGVAVAGIHSILCDSPVGVCSRTISLGAYSDGVVGIHRSCNFEFRKIGVQGVSQQTCTIIMNSGNICSGAFRPSSPVRTLIVRSNS